MNNISHIHSCYGCAVCAIACPKKIIDVRLNSNGSMNLILQMEPNV